MGYKKGEGGRIKGVKNRKNLLVEEIAAKFNIDPFEALMMFVAGDWKGLGYENECYFTEKPDGAVKMGYTITPEMRLKAASEATKYLYSQKKAVEISTEGEGFRIVVEDYLSKDKK